MLTVIVHQVLERVTRLSISDDAIELSELLEDVEEENEDKLIEFEDLEHQDFDLLKDKTIAGPPNQRDFLNIYKKILIPPP
jgi:hypothetical protein